MNPDYPTDQYGPAVTGELMQWRTDYDPATDFDSADRVFERDGRIEERVELQPASFKRVDRMPIVEGIDWSEVASKEHALHSLQAVVNTRGYNFGIATTVVDERQVTYITQFGEESQQGNLLGVLNTQEDNGAGITIFDTTQEKPEAMFTVKRTADGALYVMNDSEQSVNMGVGRKVETPAQTFRERFSLRSIFNGFKRAVRAERETRYRNRNALSGTMGWMVQANVIPATVRHMRREDMTWYVENPV